MKKLFLFAASFGALSWGTPSMALDAKRFCFHNNELYLVVEINQTCPIPAEDLDPQSYHKIFENPELCDLTSSISIYEPIPE